MINSDLQSKLLNSVAVKSLTSEQEILSALRNLGWGAIHSCFYSDITTGKLCEIDVLGRQIWERDLKGGSKQGFLYLPVEAKSIKGFHLVFSSQGKSSSFRQVNDEWLGYEGRNRERIAETLDKTVLNTEQIAFVLNKINRIAYPRSMITGSLRIDPPPAKMYAASFRETNIGAEKDLDSSVLWRASQSLSSAVNSLKEKWLKFCLDEILFGVEMSQRLKLDPVREALDKIAFCVRTIELYHPVIVVDAPLWSIERNDILETNSCRFEQIRTNGLSDWWVDIVHSSYFNQYAQELTQYYQKQFRRVGAKLEKRFF